MPVMLFVDFHQKVRAIFLRENCSHILFSIPVIKLIARPLSQYNSNWGLKYDLSEKGHFYGTYILL